MAVGWIVQVVEYTAVNVTMHHCWFHAESGLEVTARAVCRQSKMGYCKLVGHTRISMINLSQTSMGR
jgi:hypothetical protein